MDSAETPWKRLRLRLALSGTPPQHSYSFRSGPPLFLQ